MWDELTDLAQNYNESVQAKEEKEQKLSELKSDTFGNSSKETEEKARSLFEDVGLGDGTGRTQEIDKVKQEINQIEQKREELKEDLLRRLTDLRFPFDETIDQRNGEIAFPFVEPISKETIDAICEVVRNDIEAGGVRFNPEELVVKTEDVDEAIDEVKRFSNELRDAASHELNTDEYVEKLAGRDVKVKRMLCELYESDEPLAKKELELRTGVEKGGLRGVLYHVYDNDPYLVKNDKKYQLSEIGRTVIKKYLEEHEEPKMPETAEEAEKESEDEDSQMTLEATEVEE
jgi:hypothetical protein